MKTRITPQLLRRDLYSLLARMDAILGFENRQIVFSLHGVSRGKWYYNNSPVFIRKFVKKLEKRGWKPGKLSELKDNARWGRKNFYLTFDDGYKNVTSVVPFFAKRSIQPTAFLIADPMSRNIDELTTENEVMGMDEIKLLKKNGWEFGSHSMTHSDFYSLKSRKEIEKEVLLSKSRLEKRFGVEVKYFAYPRGRYTPRILKAVADAGYKYAMTMDDSLIDTKTRNHLIPRIGVNSSHTVDEAINSASPSVVLLRSLIKEILKKIKYL